MVQTRYKGDLVAGALLVNESRKVVGLMMQGLEDKEILDRVLENNLLQKRSPVSGKRQARLIVNRLMTLPGPFWNMISNGSHDQATQVLLCASIKHSPILGDFIARVVAGNMRVFKKELTHAQWDAYFEERAAIDPSLDSWSDSTRNKVRQISFLILAQAGIIDTTRKKNILPFNLLPEIRSLLREHNETYVLSCLEVFE